MSHPQISFSTVRQYFGRTLAAMNNLCIFEFDTGAHVLKGKGGGAIMRLKEDLAAHAQIVKLGLN